jgi:hypothetical protein
MSKKKSDNLGQTQLNQDKTNLSFHRGGTVEFWRSQGISSKNTTHEKLGQTTLMFINGSNPLVEDDSMETAIRYLKFKRFNP